MESVLFTSDGMIICVEKFANIIGENKTLGAGEKYFFRYWERKSRFPI